MTSERDALQKAYNGICGVLASLEEAGWVWRESTLGNDVESIRERLAPIAFSERAKYRRFHAMTGIGDENFYVDSWGMYDGWVMWRVWIKDELVGYVSTKTKNSTEAMVLALHAYDPASTDGSTP